ncbi:MAG: hypothetical protein R3F18_20855 [Lysobacterales bacterium]|nr:hypothetical protein [Xanthomonadales bacterium]MCP5460105.1 hypothetical protein [Gammaproteobacteria bacterium]
MSKGVEICVRGLTILTQGLSNHGERDLSIDIDEPDLIGDAYELALRLIQYILRDGATIKDGETVRQGMWIIKFLADGEILVANEYDEKSGLYKRGVSRTLAVLRDQQVLCRVTGSRFNPPRLDQKIVITEGIESGDGFRGIRYSAPEHMSGWWLLTDKYEGSASEKRLLCIKDLILIRPDVIPFLAIDVGVGFVFPFTWKEEPV